MAQPGSSHSFTPMEDLPSATPSVAECQPEDRHLHHFLLKTRQLTGLTPEQLSVPSLSEIGDVSLADSANLPLLCSLVHAMSAMGKEMEVLRLQTSDLESRVANSFPEGVDHSTQLNQIQSSLRDLSHRVAHLPPSQVSVPPPEGSRTPLPAPRQQKSRQQPRKPLPQGLPPHLPVLPGDSLPLALPLLLTLTQLTLRPTCPTWPLPCSVKQTAPSPALSRPLLTTEAQSLSL